MIDTDINIESKGGGSFTDTPVVFSTDGIAVFVSWKNCILSYNTKTGKRLLKYEGLRHNIIGFDVYSVDGYECLIACSSSGEIITWKVTSGYKLLEKHMPKGYSEITTFSVIPSSDDFDKWAVYSNRKQNLCSFSLVNLTTAENKLIDFTIKNSPYIIDVGNKYFVVVQKRSLYYISLKDSIHRRHIIKKGLKFTCVACHPEENCVLTGDTLGRVLLWYSLESDKPSRAVYHWHTLPVQCLAFSTSGSYFFSGGGESVLVKWQYDNALKKNFVPRLPSAIKHISVANNNLFVAISLADNGIRILDSKLELVCLIQHLVLSDSNEGNIHFDPRSKALIMNGNIGHLQFFSPYDMSLLYSLDVVGRNKITQERNTLIQNVDVKKIAVSTMGSWMATIEQRNEANLGKEVRMKFWIFNSTEQKFELNTSIEYPHEDDVKGVLFQPSGDDSELKCVSIGEDKKFKIWELQDIITPYSKSKVWKCVSVGFYKDLSSNDLAFSVDGSLLGVAFGNVVTTWAPDTCELKCSLLHTLNRQPIKFLEFGVDTQCHLLVSATNESVSVWNLLTLTMVWTVSVPVRLLVADSMTPYMAVFSAEKKLFIFSPASCQPVYTCNTKIGARKQTVLGGTFVPSLYVNDNQLNWYERTQLFFITSDKELFRLGTNTEMLEPASVVDKEGDSSLYRILQPKTRRNAVTSSTPLHHRFTKQSSKKIFEKLLEAPVHTMPPVRMISEALLQSMVLKKSESDVT